jgi:hypothetical protein
MRPDETITGTWGKANKREWCVWGRVNSTMVYLIYYKNFWKCHNVPPPSTTINK